MGGLRDRRAGRANDHPNGGNLREHLVSVHAALLCSDPRPDCDLRHRIFLSKVNLGFKEFPVDRVLSGDSVSGDWSGPVAGAMVGGAFGELAFGEGCHLLGKR